MDEQRWMSLVYGLLLLVLLWPAVRRLPAGTWLRNVAIWLGVFVVLGLVYHAFGPF